MDYERTIANTKFIFLNNFKQLKLWESNQDQRESLSQPGNQTSANGTIKKHPKMFHH